MQALLEQVYAILIGVGLAVGVVLVRAFFQWNSRRKPMRFSGGGPLLASWAAC